MRRIKEYLVYYRMFSFRFFLRGLIIRFFNIQSTEVRHLDIVGQFASAQISVKGSASDRIQMDLPLNGYVAHIVLRRKTSDLLVFNQVLLQKEYGPLYDLVVKTGQMANIEVIVDVGANIGLSSLYLSSLFPKALIYAIEPSPRNFSVLEENVKLNKLKVNIINKALLASKGRVKLSNTFRDKRDWSTRVVPSSPKGEIEAITILDLKHECNIRQIDMLKIDVEGHEAELFGSEQFLAELERIKFIAVEIHEEYTDRLAVIATLQNRGYTLVSKGETLFGVNQRDL